MATIASTRITRLQAISPRATGAVDQSGVVMSLSNEAVALPASSSGVVSSYAGATTTASVMQGAVDASSLWTFSKSDGAGVSSTFAGAVLTVSSLTADSAQVTITAARTGYASLTKVFSLSRAKDGSNGSNGSPGSNGSRGSMTFYTSGSAWSDTTANNVVTTITGSSTRVIGDTVTISTTGFAATKYWGGTAWLSPGVVIDGNLLVNGTVSATTLSGGTISGVSININSGAFQVSSAGLVTTSNMGVSVSTFGNLFNPALPCITATTYPGSSAPAIKATANSGQNAIDATGPAYISGNLTVGGSISASGGISGLSKSSVGLGNVDNTADANKSVNAAAAWGSAAFQSVGASWWTSQTPTGFIRTNYGLIPYYPG